jgi:hypothetical protein
MRNMRRRLLRWELDNGGEIHAEYARTTALERHFSAASSRGPQRARLRVGVEAAVAGGDATRNRKLRYPITPSTTRVPCYATVQQVIEVDAAGSARRHLVYLD